MPWLRFDDTVPHNRKCLKAGPAASWLWLCSIAYCQRHLTDGIVPEEALNMLGLERGVVALMARLCEVGLMHAVGGGYQVHDYHDHNATAEEARANRQTLGEKRAKSGRMGGIRSGISRRSNEGKSKQAEVSKQPANEAPTRPDPLQEIPPTPHAAARGIVMRVTRSERKRAEEIRRLRFGCTHTPACPTSESCVRSIVADIRAKVGS